MRQKYEDIVMIEDNLVIEIHNHVAKATVPLIDN